MGAYYFLACLLPPLPGTLGEKLGVSFPEASAILKRNIHPSDEHLLNALLYSIDTANWENLDQGRGPFIEGGVLSKADFENRRELPDFITAFEEEREKGIRRSYPYDRLWEIYYDNLFEQARRSNCRYLLEYVPWEVELRNSLATLRAREIGKNPEDSTVHGQLRDYDFSPILTQLKTQKNPLLSERYLDEERLRRIARCEGNSVFALDAILAYVSRLMIFSRWEKMSAAFDFDNFLYGGGTT
ncbi:MAG TPA: DUF2764 family protein [Syntrophales bacterium]|nr:DUF2764 family protein [Syntrophales bacterium]